MLCSLPMLPAECKACTTETQWDVGIRKTDKISVLLLQSAKLCAHPSPNSTVNPTK